MPRLAFSVRRLARANYEREMDLLDVLCDPARTSIDVGAKDGMYTYRLLDRSRDVVAFEPGPMHAHMLSRVFGARCRVERMALSNTAGAATMRIPVDRAGAAKFGRATIESTNDLSVAQARRVLQLPVSTRRLDDFGFSAVGFIKIDVEGHELAVLEGGQETLTRSRPRLLVEANDDHRDDAVATVCHWLAARGYQGFFLDRTARFLGVEEFDRERHSGADGIENFIFVHRDDGLAHGQLAWRAHVALRS